MNHPNLHWIAGYIWGLADDVLRDLYVRGKYRDVILPMTVLRRLDAVLTGTKQAVLDMKGMLDEGGIIEQDAALRQAAGHAFYNFSKFTLHDLRARASRQQLEADFRAYLDGFSPNVQDILDSFEFRNQIPRLSKSDSLGTLIERLTSPEINLSPDPVRNGDGSIRHPGLDNHGMGTIFEELVRRFNEENNEEAGEHWTPRDAVRLMARLVFLPVASEIRSGGNRLHPTNSNPGTGFGNTYSGTISVTHVVSPTFLVDGYYGYTLVDTNVEQQRLDENLGWTVLGIPGLQSDRFIDGGWPRLRIDGFEGLGMSNSFQPYYRSDPQNQFVFNANWTKGTHNIRFGTDIYLQDLDHNQPEFSGGTGAASGEFRFRQNTTERRGGERGNDYNAQAAWLLGLPQNAGKIWQFDENGYFTRTKLLSFYVRDRWQITPKLTMSYGIRYEIYPFPTRASRGLERYDFDNNKIWACGAGSIPTDCGIDIGKHNVVPRFGVAYRIDESSVLRFGYGITVDPFNWARPLRTNYPIMAKDGPGLPNSYGYSTTLRQGLEVINEPSLGDGVLDLPLNTVVRTMDTNNLTRGYIQSWNITLERRFGDWIGSAGYVATRSVNQLAGLDQNWGDIGEGNAGRQLNKQFGRTATTQLFGSLGTARYDSLKAKLVRTFANGFQMNLGYTWAHGRGYTDEDSGDGPAFFRIPRFYHRTYGDLNQDIRQNFQATAIYELPFGRGKRLLADSALGKALGGWQLNGLFSAYTGTPFSVTASSRDLNAAGSSQIGDCVSEPRHVKAGSNALWIDPSAFAQPDGARFGTCGPNSVRGPGLVSLDMGLFRKVQISEKLDLQIRVEALNVSNMVHFERPNSRDVNSGTFMILNRIRNTGREGIDERTFRLGLRFGW